MSSDNFYWLRNHEGRFVVTMEFASSFDESNRFLGVGARVFDTWREAHEYAHLEYSEYGVRDDTGADPEAELRAENERLRTECDRLQQQIQNMHDAGLGPDDWGPEEIARLRKIAIERSLARRG